ncbi:DEAD/DEAH box helicase [Acetivibrio mesophilus]|uniref:ATP-dependent RNA helicase CshA n=1 Tax=Acetivibrio mesophilus TaxID=2487273 RepID=A0A4V1K2M0_9FIRM|nr:DEAD/DEAH box helicase [Acetivibrio mesophilus]ODM26189.1 RNA helicase [Clostridium sp. Bc-iso-3]RXE60759.1 DEAD/DEAH box helicase [Acetivibrio mesophilus]HHV28175.1 DEAD/DEAH box helicase [Clostridium sp.]
MEKIKFSQMPISGEILRAVEDMGYEEATSIQTKSIPIIISGRDMIGHSQTGTGKTAAFGIPALERINAEDKALQALVLCPTRELAIQASGEIRKFAKYKHGIKALPIYGGQPIDRQIKALKQGVQIVVGTPGRVMDHMRRRTLKLKSVSMVVLDEADEMLNMGFRDDIETILKEIPEERQTVLFSATMSKDILSLAKSYLKDPELVKVVHKQLTVAGIEQNYCEVSQSRKLEVLSRLLDMYNPKLSLVFCNTKKTVDELVNDLQQRGYMADGLHGDMNQAARNRVMNAFRNGKIDVLVATDVAARGIDIDDIEAVFNYDIPHDEEYYVHRIGRTGRAGRTGRSFTLVSGRKELIVLKNIQRYTNEKINLKPIPTVNDLKENKTTRFIDDIKSVIAKGGINEYAQIVEQLIEEDYNSVDIAAALIKMALEKDTGTREYNIEEDENDTSDCDAFKNYSAQSGMSRLFINVGRKDKVAPRDIVGAIAGETGIRGKIIGSIDVYDKYTFVEVPHENVEDVLTIMKNSQIKGKRIIIEPAKSRR